MLDNYPDDVRASDPSAPWNARPSLCECLHCRAIVESEDSQVIDEGCGEFGDGFDDRGLCYECAEIVVYCTYCGELEEMKFAIGILEDSAMACEECAKEW